MTSKIKTAQILIQKSPTWHFMISMPIPLILATASASTPAALDGSRVRLRGNRPFFADQDEPDPDGPIPVTEYVSLASLAEVGQRGGSEERGLILGRIRMACAVDGEILNKPLDREDAERMIRLQEGRELEVVTGLCLYRADRREWVGAVEVTVCHCRVLTDEERLEHLDSGRWEGKAGAYGVQDNDPFVTVLRGSWTNVVGLPMERLAEILELNFLESDKLRLD